MKKPLLLLACLSALPAAANDFETGGDLYAVCRQAADPSKRNDLAFGLCMGYIDGYISGYRFNKEINGSPSICSDIEQRSRREVLKAVVDHLGAHEEDRLQLKSIAMYRALLGKMTCPAPAAKGD